MSIVNQERWIGGDMVTLKNLLFLLIVGDMFEGMMTIPIYFFYLMSFGFVRFGTEEK